MSTWKYQTEFRLFENGQGQKERVYLRYFGVCTDPNCPCEGSMEYDRNEDFNAEADDLKALGYKETGVEYED